MSAQTGSNAASFTRPRAFETVLYGGLAVGVLEGLAAIVSAGLRGTEPLRVFQFIASGLLGVAAFSGGLRTALMGVLIHFLIAFVAAAVYFRVSISLPVLIRQAAVCGVIYGVAVYFFMSRLVVPLSQTRKSPFSWSQLVTGVIIHILFVGLPIALIARRSARLDISA